MPVALVTGASRGIGRAIALALSENGWSVAVNYCQNDRMAQMLTEQLRSHAPAVCLKADIGDACQAEALIEDARAQLGRIDLLVNNAGISAIGLFQDMTPEMWRELMRVNLDGAFYCTRAVLPDMISQKKGVIINISSMWGQVGASCEVAYSAAKAGLIGMTRALAKEVGPSGIRVNCIAPGVIDTDMNAHLDEQTMRELAEETPLQRIGTPEDIAKAVLFLAGDQASFITGQVLGVNGGLII